MLFPLVFLLGNWYNVRVHFKKVCLNDDKNNKKTLQIPKKESKMKKFFAMLMMATLLLSLAAVAGPTYDLKDGLHENGFAVLKPTQYNASTNTTTYKKSNLKLDYTVSGSINRKLAKGFDKNGDPIWHNASTGGDGSTDWDLGHVYFTAHDDFRMTLFVDTDPNQTKGEYFINTELDLKDYGIYLYNNNDPTAGISEFISLKNGDTIITGGMNFGVYYTADTTYGTRVNPDPKYGETEEARVKYNEKYDMSEKLGLTGTTTGTYTTDQNWVASYDGAKDGNHNLEAHDAWYSDTDITSREAIFCMFQGQFFDADSPAFLEWEHVEFGFVTTGQPLPGTLATILISGLCAAGLRKKSKKH